MGGKISMRWIIEEFELKGWIGGWVHDWGR